MKAMSSQSARQKFIYKYDERNRKLEPMELAYIDVPDEFAGTVIQKLSLRKGELQGMQQQHPADTPVWSSPSRPED